MTHPKIIQIQNVANILNISFDDGSTRYLKADWAQELQDAFAPKKKKNFGTYLGMGTNMWLGSTYEVDSDGNVLVNGSKKYTAKELWENSKTSIAKL